jgi:ABC-type antimicrobial peptide transport system permease subunit
MVMRQVVLLSGAGLAIGALLALALGSLIRTQLYALQPRDPFTFASAGLVLSAAVGMAGLIPSWRASRIDPMQSLRNEYEIARLHPNVSEQNDGPAQSVGKFQSFDAD